MNKQAAKIIGCGAIMVLGLGASLGYMVGMEIDRSSEPRFAAEATAWAKINQSTATPVPELATAEEYLARGIKLWEDGYFQEPIADFTRAIELDPTLADAYFYRGWVYHARDPGKSPMELADALADYDRAIELDPEHSRAYNNRGYMFLRREPERAIADFERAVEIDPDYMFALINLTVAYEIEGELGKLIEVCFTLDELNIRGDFFCFDTSLVGMARELNDHEHIVELLTRFMEEDKEQGVTIVPDRYIERGQAYNELGQYPAAIADFTRALKLFEERDEIPDDANNIVLARAQAYAANEDYVDALIDYDFLIENEPDNVDYYWARGDVYYANEQYTEALADYQRVDKLNQFPDHDLADRIAELEARIAEQGQE